MSLLAGGRSGRPRRSCSRWPRARPSQVAASLGAKQARATLVLEGPEAGTKSFPVTDKIADVPRSRRRATEATQRRASVVGITIRNVRRCSSAGAAGACAGERQHRHPRGAFIALRVRRLGKSTLLNIIAGSTSPPTAPSTWWHRHLADVGLRLATSGPSTSASSSVVQTSCRC